jgi:CysZ protein
MSGNGEAAWPAVTAALWNAVPVFFTWRVLALIALPIVGAGVVWAVVGYAALAPFADWLARNWLGGGAGLGGALAYVVAALALVVGAVLTALVAVAVLAMPVLVAAVAQRYFPELARRQGGTMLGSVGNAAIAIALFLPLWLACLALLWVPPLYVAASLALSAWLNQRLFRYDALAEHADPAEMREVIMRSRRKLLLLGFLLAPLSLVPLLNLIAPLYAGIAFACLCLAELSRQRAR